MLLENTESETLNNMVNLFPKQHLLTSYLELRKLGLTPNFKTLFLAVQRSNLELIKEILDDPISHQWNLNQRLEEEHHYSLIEIILIKIGHFSEDYHLRILDLLIKKGANPGTFYIEKVENVKIKVKSSLISLTILDGQLNFPFSSSIWKALEILLKNGLNVTTKINSNQTLFHYWISNYIHHKRRWDNYEMNDFFKVLDIIVANGQKFDFCQINRSFIKDLPSALRNDSRWYPIMLQLFHKFEIETIDTQITDANYLCLICREKPRNQVFCPCNHLILCRDCSEKVKKEKICPACRSFYREVIEIYFP